MPDLLFSKPLQVEEIKADGDEWQVSGYVSTFGNVDLGGDVVEPGAFKKTLKSGPKVRFLLSHDPRQVLGTPKKLHEDSKGLFGQFKISKTQLGGDTRQLLLDDAIDSFSIGYSADTYTIDQKEGVRHLDAVTLYEASLVAMPMNPAAVVTGVKEYGVTLAERVHEQAEALKELFDEIRGLTEQGRPLNEVKQKEITELLEMFSGMDDVRSKLQSLTAVSSNLVEAHRVKSQLAQVRKRLAQIEKE